MTNKDKINVKNPSSLSPTEQKIYSTLYSERVITTDDVKDIVGDPHKAADYITKLRKKGYFKKIRKGLYAIASPDMIDQAKARPDKFLVASKLRDEYFISHHSALEIHGLSQTIQNRVYITAKTHIQPFTYSDICYKVVTTKHFFGFEKRNHLDSTIVVSDREKTILDCIRKIKYAGGLEEILKSFENLPALNTKNFIDYLNKINEKGLYQKTGFILERLEITGFEDIHDKLLSKVGKRTHYLDEDRDSFYVKKWNLMVPKRFEEWIQSA